jgi:hypothetical protein
MSLEFLDQFTRTSAFRPKKRLAQLSVHQTQADKGSPVNMTARSQSLSPP